MCKVIKAYREYSANKGSSIRKAHFFVYHDGTSFSVTSLGYVEISSLVNSNRSGRLLPFGNFVLLSRSSSKNG